ncbi:hypothetical protein FS837_013017 [Tulasnella sp. UAMH 9824]|nr:hypothetical protein FS837_013017 [Tulasnella sp. UAMH 9824]
MSKEAETWPHHQPEAHSDVGGSTDDTDLLIRSTTTLLQFVGHRSTEGIDRSTSRQHGELLDKAALVFVSGTKPANVAAVTHWEIDSAGPQLVVDVIQEGHKYNRARNAPTTSASSAKPPTLGDPEAMRMLEEDMVNFFHLRGIDAITVEMHAKKLQSLLNAIHKNGHINPAAAKNELGQYIHAYCAHNIWDNLNTVTCPPGYDGRMLHFFVKPDYSGPSHHREQFAKEIPLTFKLRDKSELWLSELFKRLNRNVPCHEITIEDGRIVQLLALDQENIWHLYSALTTALRVLCVNLTKVKSFVQERAVAELQQADRDGFIKALEYIHSSSSFLYLLTRKSPSFWRLIELLGSTIPPPKLEPPRVQCSTPGLQKTSLVEDSGTYTQDNETRDGKADIGLLECHSFLEFCEKWFDSITQWVHVMEDLSERRDVRAIVKRGIVIQARDTTEPAQNRKQMSLMKTLEQISDRKPDEVLYAVRQLAKRQVASFVVRPWQTRHAGIPSALEILVDDSEGSLEGWDEAFSGTIHCEADLACQMASQNNEVKDKSIGVSRRSCFCCAVLLKHLGLKPASSPTHLKFQAWAPPPTATRDAKQAVLDELIVHLKRVVDNFCGREDGKGTLEGLREGSESDLASTTS